MKHWLSAALGAAALVMASGSTAPSLAAASADSSTAPSCPAQRLSVNDKQALKVLQQPPFPPTDKSLFTPQVYGGEPLQPPGPYSFTETSLKIKLSLLLAKRFGGNLAKIRGGLAVYDDAGIKARVPDPRLRMGVAVLKGTIGEAVFSVALPSGELARIRFGDVVNDGIGMSVGSPAESVINTRLQYEDPTAFSSLLMHEALHLDRIGTQKEELINHILDTLAYGQVLLDFPWVAYAGTELPRRFNTKLMALINSRDADGRLRVLTSQGNVYPGGTPLAYFAAAFGPLGADTPGNTTLPAVLKAVTKVNLAGPNFDDGTVTLLDTCQRLFSPSQVLQLAKILKLDTRKQTLVAAN